MKRVSCLNLRVRVVSYITTRLLQRWLDTLSTYPTISLESTKIYEKPQAQGVCLSPSLLKDIDAENGTTTHSKIIMTIISCTHRAVWAKLSLGHVEHQVGSRLYREAEVDESVCVCV